MRTDIGKKYSNIQDNVLHKDCVSIRINSAKPMFEMFVDSVCIV